MPCFSYYSVIYLDGDLMGFVFEALLLQGLERMESCPVIVSQLISPL